MTLRSIPIWTCLIWLALFTLPTTAAPVRVTSGEHEGFSRLVMEFGAPVNWSVGRTVDGYALRLEGMTPGYDLSAVFDLIGRDRLSAIWTDPESGDLRLGINCPCHAIPFEFRPGIVVIDLRDGPPPTGSSFELALAGTVLPLPAEEASAGVATPAPKPQAGYDWTQPYREPAVAGDGAGGPVPAAKPQALPLGDLTLEPLRDALLRQLSRGVAQGVVDMAPPPARAGDSDEPFASAAFRMGEQSNILIGGIPATDESLTAAGASCAPDARLAVESWADDRPVSEQLGAMLTGLTGEFDQPDAQAVARAVRFHLSIGFGIEARMLLRAFPGQHEDADLWTSMAHILDDEPDPHSVFAGMLGCDTSAAMWAMLTDPAPVAGDVIAAGAVQRAFSALPLHLRRQLGPRLADRFLALDDADAAYAIRQAILRVSGDAGPEVALMEARIAAHDGNLAEAEATTGAVLDDPGPAGAEALAAMVDLKAAQNAPVDAATVTALSAYVKEQGDGPQAAALHRALTLAQALSGNFDAALAAQDTTPETATDIWRLLSRLAPDDAMLEHAVLAPGQSPPAAALAVALPLAQRLLDLGFADQAAGWAALDPAADPMFLVRIALQRRDGREALRLLAGREDEPAQLARAEALRLLGDEPGVAAIFAALGQGEAEWAAQRRAQDWPGVAAAGPDSWKAAAATLAPPSAALSASAPPSGPLAESAALLAGSAATRQALALLLASVPPP